MTQEDIHSGELAPEGHEVLDINLSQYIGDVLSVEFAECNIATGELNRLVTSLAGQNITRNHSEIKVFTTLGEVTEENRDFAVISRCTTEPFTLLVLKPMTRKITQAKTSTKIFRTTSKHAENDDGGDPILAVQITPDSLLTLATFAERKNGLCTYVQLGTEINNDNVIAVEADTKTSRHLIIEELRVLLDDKLLKNHDIYPNIHNFIEQEILKYSRDVLAVKQEYLIKLITRYLESDRREKLLPSPRLVRQRTVVRPGGNSAETDTFEEIDLSEEKEITWLSQYRSSTKVATSERQVSKPLGTARRNGKLVIARSLSSGLISINFVLSGLAFNLFDGAISTEDDPNRDYYHSLTDLQKMQLIDTFTNDIISTASVLSQNSHIWQDTSNSFSDALTKFKHKNKNLGHEFELLGKADLLISSTNSFLNSFNFRPELDALSSQLDALSDDKLRQALVELSSLNKEVYLDMTDIDVGKTKNVTVRYGIHIERVGNIFGITIKARPLVSDQASVVIFSEKIDETKKLIDDDLDPESKKKRVVKLSLIEQILTKTLSKYSSDLVTL